MHHESDFDDSIDQNDDLDGLYHDDEEIAERPQPTLPEVIAAIQAIPTDGFTVTLYYGLADLEPEAAAQAYSALQSISAEMRHRLLEQLVDISEMNFDLDYTEFALAALEDDDSQVRVDAVELLWADETADTLRRLLDVALEDDVAAVRAAAASALGPFILLGEYGSLPPEVASSAIDACLSLYNDQDEDIEVRRRALESLGNSSHDGIEALISEAYSSSEQLMRISAVFAMGRTATSRWEPVILRELNSDDPEMRYEAARAAGDLGLENAVARLSRMAYERDREIKEVALWSLGEIGSRAAMTALERLSQDPDFVEDEQLAELLEDAIAAASLPGSSLLMFDIDDDEYLDDLLGAVGDDDDWADDQDDPEAPLQLQ